MGKTLADPLFIGLVIASVGLWLRRPGRRLGGRTDRKARLGFLLGIAASAGLWLLGTPAAESMLIDSLSRRFEPPDAAAADIDVVVVLAGGFVPAPAAAYDQPDGWSTARTVQGARTFLESGARLFVISGKGPGPDPTRLGEAMKRLAVQLGVPADRIVLEPHSPNTKAHPVELARLDVVRPGDTVGIVTSSWHLPRAMREFQRRFPDTVAVPAFDTAVNEKTGWRRWLPRSRSLANSAAALAEYVGMLWYSLL